MLQVVLKVEETGFGGIKFLYMTTESLCWGSMFSPLRSKAS